MRPPQKTVFSDHNHKEGIDNMRGRPSREVRRQIIELTNQKKTPEEISSVVGLSPECIRRFQHAHICPSLTTPAKFQLSPDVELVVELRICGKTTKVKIVPE